MNRTVRIILLIISGCLALATLYFLIFTKEVHLPIMLAGINSIVLWILNLKNEKKPPKPDNDKYPQYKL